jgi:hypothetical protein
MRGAASVVDKYRGTETRDLKACEVKFGRHVGTRTSRNMVGIPFFRNTAGRCFWNITIATLFDILKDLPKRGLGGLMLVSR